MSAKIEHLYITYYFFCCKLLKLKLWLGNILVSAKCYYILIVCYSESTFIRHNKRHNGQATKKCPCVETITYCTYKNSEKKYQ